MMVRVAESGRSPFQLRKGEAAISVFEEDAVDPPLTDDEILHWFRPGSFIIRRTQQEIAVKGLLLAVEPGADLFLKD
jgi:hypothetical protein